jgi:uncharacterized OB-fold protein
MNVEPIVKKFYEHLDEGKIMGLKCKECGSHLFPPVAACRSCSSRDLEWTEMSGEGELLFYSSSTLPAVRFVDYAPYAYGLVKLKEGPVFLTMISGVEAEDTAKMEELFRKLPLPVRAKVEEIAGANIVTFELQ